MDARLRLFLTYLHQWYFSNKLCVLCVFSGFRGPCGGEIFPGGGGSGGAEYTGWCRWSRKVSEQIARHIQRHPDRLQRGCLFCTLPLQHSFTLAQKRTFWQDCCVIFTLFAQKQPQQMIVLLCAALPCPARLLWRHEEDLCESVRQIQTATTLHLCSWEMFKCTLYIFLKGVCWQTSPCVAAGTQVYEESKDRRDSVRSEDGGVQRDLRERDFDYREQPLVRNRRYAFKNMNPADKLTLMSEKIEASPGSSPDRGSHAKTCQGLSLYPVSDWFSSFFRFLRHFLWFHCVCITVSLHSCTFSFSINVCSPIEREGPNVSFWPRSWTYSCTTSQSPMWRLRSVHLWVTQSHSTRRRLIGLNCRRLYMTRQHLFFLTGYPMSGWRQVVSRLLIGKSGSMVQQPHQQSVCCNLQAGWNRNRRDKQVNGHTYSFVRLERQYYTYTRMSTNNSIDNRLDHSKYRYKHIHDVYHVQHLSFLFWDANVC